LRDVREIGHPGGPLKDYEVIVKQNLRLIQIQSPKERRVGVAGDQRIRLLAESRSVFALAGAAISSGSSLRETVERELSEGQLDYDAIYQGQSEWRILPVVDHPEEAARCLVTGTGLTHLASASRRDAMHAAGENVTDSIRMYNWGVEGGKPAAAQVGAAPEWFYKGNGAILRAHNDPLAVPPYAEDGGEEPEIVGVYIIDASGNPRRIGLTVGNEFSDHRLEKRNYLYLAHSKLRECAIGPELAVDPEFASVEGKVSVERAGKVLWEHPIRSGENSMCHSLANLEHHHFKYEQHRRPGDLHVHFFGADAFSFGDGIELKDADVMKVEFEGFGRALRNSIRIEQSAEKLVEPRPL
jgi:hypothetical protein